MKTGPLLFAVSLLANAGLVAAYVLKAPPDAGETAVASPRAAGNASADAAAAPHERGDALATGAGITAGADEADSTAGSSGAGALWKALQHDDLKTFAGNLRRAGMPEHAVRAIVSAEIDRRYAERERALGGNRTPRRFWEPDDDFESMDARLAQLELRREKAELKADVLGADATSLEQTFESPIAAEKRELVKMITDDYNAMIREIRGRGDGILLESEKQMIAVIQESQRRDLASLLSPQELTDFEMINSPTFRRLRNELRGFEATEQEFRAIYALEKEMDDRFRPDPAVRRMPSPEERQLQAETRAAMGAQLRELIGDARYADFSRAREREFQQLNQLVRRVNLPEEKAIEAFAVRDRVSAASVQIWNDREMPLADKRASMAALAQSARNEIRATLPGEIGEAYLNVADGWLKRVEEGVAVEFGDRVTRFRSLPNRDRRPPTRRSPAPPAPSG